MILEITILLLQLAIKSTVIFAVAFIFAGMLRRLSSAERHLIWISAFIGLLILPVMSFMVPEINLPLNSVSGFIEAVNNNISNQAGIPGNHQDITGNISNTTNIAHQHADILNAPESNRNGLIKLIVYTYCIVTLFLLIRISIRLLRIHSTLRSLNEIRDAHLVSLTGRLRSQTGMRRKIRLVSNRTDCTPWVWGLFRPIIVLPCDFPDWPEELQNNAIVHEMAHIIRLDLLNMVFGYLCCVIYWFQPLSWLALKRMNREAEKACDDRVLFSGASNTGYARQLLDIADRIYTSTGNNRPVLAMSGTSKFSLRIHSILDSNTRRNTVGKYKILLALMITLCVSVPVASLNSHAAKQNQSISRLEDAEFQSLAKKGPANDDELGLIVRTYLANDRKQNAQQALVSWLLRKNATNEPAICVYCKTIIRADKSDPMQLKQYKLLLAALKIIENRAYETKDGNLLLQLATVYSAGREKNNTARSLYYYMEALRVGNISKPGDVKLNIAMTLSEMGRFEEARLVLNQLHNDKSSGYYHSKITQSWIKYLDIRIDYSNRIVARLIDSKSIGADDYLPLTKVQPVYPEAALKAGKEGYAVVEFTVTSNGRTRDVKVIESTDPVFDAPTVKAASDFLYMPRIADGKPVDVHGVRNKITYVLPR